MDHSVALSLWRNHPELLCHFSVSLSPYLFLCLSDSTTPLYASPPPYFSRRTNGDTRESLVRPCQGKASGCRGHACSRASTEGGWKVKTMTWAGAAGRRSNYASHDDGVLLARSLTAGAGTSGVPTTNPNPLILYSPHSFYSFVGLRPPSLTRPPQPDERVKRVRRIKN